MILQFRTKLYEVSNLKKPSQYTWLDGLIPPLERDVISRHVAP